VVVHGFQYLYAEWLSTDNALLMGFWNIHWVPKYYSDESIIESAGTVCGQFHARRYTLCYPAPVKFWLTTDLIQTLHCVFLQLPKPQAALMWCS